MGDMGDFWRDVSPDMKERSRIKRKSNRENSVQLLIKQGIEFIPKNGGAHLILSVGVDFWPGTGKWYSRRDKRYDRGVKRLIDFVKQENQK